MGVLTQKRSLSARKAYAGGALRAFWGDGPLLLAALRSPQVLLGMLFNAWLLAYFLLGRVQLADIAFFYLMELGLYAALYLPPVLFHILGDARKPWRAKKELLEELAHWVFFGLGLPVILLNSYAYPLVGYREQAAQVLQKLSLAGIPFALQFCLGAYAYLSRPRHRYAFEAAFYPFCWYFAGQASIWPFMFFIAVPGWFLTGGPVPGVAAFLLLRILNEPGPHMAAQRFEADLDHNLRLDEERAAWELRGEK